MKRIARVEPIKALVRRLNLPDDIASRLRLYEDDAPSTNGRMHMTLEFVETRGVGSRVREIPVASRYAEVGRMQQILESQEEMATFIDLAIGACGKDTKPDVLPEFVRNHSIARETRQLMRKASKIASQAASSEQKTLKMR